VALQNQLFHSSISQSFVWMPTLVTTTLIGFGVSWSVVLGTLSVYTSLSLVTLTFMGSYSSAKRHAVEMSEEISSSDKADEVESDEKESDVEVVPNIDYKEVSYRNSSSTFNDRNSSSMLGYSDVETFKSSTTDLQHSQDIEQSFKSQQKSASTYSNASSVISVENNVNHIENKNMPSSNSGDGSDSAVSLRSSFNEIARLGRC